MTAEIAIMNKSAVALAADSAVTKGTLGGPKIYYTANKLFRLSKHHPVGIMLYDQAAFLGVPWETIIKVYRKRLGSKNFGTLEGFASDFIEFLHKENSLFPDSQQEEYFQLMTMVYFDLIDAEIRNTVKERLKQRKRKGLGKGVISKIASEVIDDHRVRLEEAESLTHIPRQHSKAIIKKYETAIGKVKDAIFNDLPIYKKDIKKLREIAGSYFLKNLFLEGYSSGIVIAGFGEADPFPRLQAFKIEGLVNNQLKYVLQRHNVINFNNPALVSAFAQSEMVHTFMEGIDPGLDSFQERYVYDIFLKYPNVIIDLFEGLSKDNKQQLLQKLRKAGKLLYEDYQKGVQRCRQKYYVNPVTTVVGFLPYDELAAMAEALVNLTSLKRRISIDAETVGGPIDVAVISKGDGFVWIKRKYYFDRELNPQYYTAHYLKEE